MKLKIKKTSTFFLIFFMICCNSCTNIDKHSNSSKKSKSTVGRFDERTKYLIFKEYSLSITSKECLDTLANIDYQEDKYSSPIILNQYLVFYGNNKVFKKYSVPINLIKKKTINNVYLDALQTPIYEICLTKSEKNKYFYLILGSDYCNGSDCLEFIGIYSLDGIVIYEGLSNSKESTLRDKLFINKINLNDKIKCVDIDD